MQRPLPDGGLHVVLRGPKQDDDAELTNLAERISAARAIAAAAVRGVAEQAE